MILADENIDHSIIESIRQAGIDVYSIYEQQRGINDAAVIEFSRNPPRIILTEDKDFGELIAVQRRPHSGIIRLLEITSFRASRSHARGAGALSK